jgi:hypothetical protein
MYQVTRLVPSAVINSSFSLVSEFKTLRPTLCVILDGTGLNHGAKEQIPHGTGDEDEVIGAVPFGEADDEPPAPWCRVSVSAPSAAAVAPVSSPDMFIPFFETRRLRKSNLSLLWEQRVWKWPSRSAMSVER